MFRRTILPLIAATLFSGLAIAAEDPAPGPPRVLLVAREEIKPGSMGSHEKIAAEFVSAMSKTKLENYRLGLTPVSGDDNQVLYLEAYDSFAALEAARSAMDKEVANNAAFKASLDQVEMRGGPMHASQKTAIAVYREDLSYRPLKMNDVAKARYFNVTTVRVKQGQSPDYVEYSRQFNAARAKANLDEHTAAYQIVTGASAGTFLFFSTSRSLTEWDEYGKNLDARTKAIDEALGGESVVKQRRQLAGEIVTDSASSLYALSPAISRPAPQFAAYDPDFWSPKPKAPAKALAVKKEPAKESKP
jgi:hypothetical protein